MEKVNIGFDINNDSNALISMSSTHKDYDYCGSMFIGKILTDIENHLKDKETSANLSTIDITGVFNGKTVCDIEIDGKSFFRDADNSNSLITRLAKKAVQVIRFNYDIPAEDEIKVNIITRTKIKSGLYFCFRFQSEKIDITLDNIGFPEMRKPATDALLKSINDDINKIEININARAGLFDKEIITSMISSLKKDKNFHYSVNLLNNTFNVIECMVLKIETQCLIFEIENLQTHLSVGPYSTIRKILTKVILSKANGCLPSINDLSLNDILFTKFEEYLTKEFEKEKNAYVKQLEKEEISLSGMEFNFVYNIDLRNQDLATIEKENLDKKLHEKAMYAMGVPEDFINKQVEILKFEDENIKKSTDYKEYYSFKNVYDLLSDGYSVDSQLATRVFEKFEHEIDTTACRIAMIEYLDSITPSNVIAKIGFKEVAGGDVFAVVSKLQDNNANINCEDYDAFEIVIKVKSPKCAELDIMDIRNQFAMKYPELKDDIVLAKKIDVQGNIASILETKLKYDAMFILTNNYVNKENMIMSTIKDKDIIDYSEKNDFDRAVHNVRNSIVTEIKK